MAKTGPNEPCPCGSGKKFKKCCQFKVEQEQRLAREQEESARMNQALQDSGGSERIKSKGKFYEFAMPLLYQSEGEDAEQEGLDLAALIFNLCLIREPNEREKKRGELVRSIFGRSAERQRFDYVIGLLLKRFEKVFPELTEPSKAESVQGPGDWTLEPPLGELLTFGQTGFGIASIDYEDMGIGEKHIPDLIRMLNTSEFWTEKSPENWTPLHAWRALGQLRAKEAIEPLVEIIKQHHDSYIVQNDIGLPFGFLGFEPFPKLRALALDPSLPPGAKALAYQAIGHIAKTWPMARAECGTFLSEQLAKDEELELNGAIMESLIVGVGVTELSETMSELLAKGRLPADFGTEQDIRESILRSQEISKALNAL